MSDRKNKKNWEDVLKKTLENKHSLPFANLDEEIEKLRGQIEDMRASLNELNNNGGDHEIREKCEKKKGPQNTQKSTEAGKKKRSRTWVQRTTWGDGRFLFCDRVYGWKEVPALTHVRVKPTENFESTREVTVQYLCYETTLTPFRPTEYTEKHGNDGTGGTGRTGETNEKK